jgi:hypothetical protein
MERIAYLYGGFYRNFDHRSPPFSRNCARVNSYGQADLFSPSSPQQLTRCVEEIIKAVNQMALEKTGAIIAITQQVPLGEFAETGVRIDSKVTSELLKTIFYEGTPLHDMAVLIQGDRIIAARVQLPLAEADSAIYGQLGSRHRAAIGCPPLTLVVVVSEETGSFLRHERTSFAISPKVSCEDTSIPPWSKLPCWNGWDIGSMNGIHHPDDSIPRGVIIMQEWIKKILACIPDY